MKAKILYPLYFIILVTCILVISSDLLVKNEVKGYLYDSVDSIPYNKVGLLLGTAKYLENGELNEYYTKRIQAATDLYNSGKIKYIIVSGDNSTPHYNEPAFMKDDLIANGIPCEVIFLDYAGLRTLDSVVRSKEIFGQESITVISQPFHNERAIYLANENGIHAIGYNAENVYRMNGLKTDFRERFARIKMFTDIWFGKGPKFIDETIVIPY